MNAINLAHSVLALLPPKLAHRIGLEAIKRRIFADPDSASELTYDLFGFQLKSPLGLAAGFDKNGIIVNQIVDYGFGWDEVGSITWGGGKGNKDLVLDRLPRGLWNRLGLNGDPAYQIVERLTKVERPFAVNIAKTHSLDIVGDKAIEDVVKTNKLVVGRLANSGKLIYVVQNLSCPNTKEGKPFEDPSVLKELCAEINPILLGRVKRGFKISPNHPKKTLEGIVEVLEGEKDFVDFYICCNTYPMEHPRRTYLRGGGSGKIVQPLTLQTIKSLRQMTKKTIIAVGGISTGYDMWYAHDAGADFFQAYDGFAHKSNLNPYAGPRFAQEVVAEYLYLLKAEEKTRQLQK